MHVRVNLEARGYDIAIGSDVLTGLGPFTRARTQGSRAFVVTDEHVGRHAQAAIASLAQAGFDSGLAVLPAGEAQKSLATASLLYDRLAELPADRETVVVPVGGGVMGDLAGFVAATYARGLPLLMVPTTLLAMVDSGVGGKVGINHPRGKNLIGAFHQPIGVWIDIATLDTLPDREYRSGLAEVVKYGVILDGGLFAELEAQAEAILRREPAVIEPIIRRCCQLKVGVVERDEREESGLRALLNYGHTFAHAFEAAGSYGSWLHGEAVAAGMACASRLAERRGLIPSEVSARQMRLLARFGLPTAPAAWPIADLLAAMRNDKKARAGRLRFVLPRKLGEGALVDDIPASDVEQVLRDLGLS
jgi:3-dehydroquinate synthase